MYNCFTDLWLKKVFALSSLNLILILPFVSCNRITIETYQSLSIMLHNNVKTDKESLKPQEESEELPSTSDIQRLLLKSGCF